MLSIKKTPAIRYYRSLSYFFIYPAYAKALPIKKVAAKATIA